jgi:hypothetical protein
MRRIFWMGVGAVAGASGTIWAERKVRSRLEALQPDHLVVTAGNRALSVGRTVVDAVAEGRGAMREREAELRGRLELDTRPDHRSHVASVTAPTVRERPATRPRTVEWPSPRHHR